LSSPSDPSDPTAIQAVLARAVQGDEHAWREIVETYSRRLFGLVFAQCRDAELAEEITQSTFCTVASKLASYTEVGRFEQWLFRIGMNRLRDEMRRRRRQAIPMEADTLMGLAGGHVPEEPTDPLLLRALRESMDRLSEADREVVHLRHFGGLSFRQIADVLDQPLGTVLARQHRALRKLRDLIEEAQSEGDTAEGEPT